MRYPSLIMFAAMATANLALAAEGMWLPSEAPEIAPAMKKAGVQLDAAALSNLQAAPMNAIVSLGGCSAAFVSPKGLVVSNHHCVYGSIQYNSKPERDLLQTGFLAKTLDAEMPAAPGTRVFVIEDLRDVTAQMNQGLGPNVTDKARFDALKKNEKALVAACEAKPNRRCEVRSYFGGATYYLQQQLEIKDVRLVYAPAESIGNFGGEVDNWQWPRHTGDFGFYRAYVAPDGSSAPYAKENVPYASKSWLKMADKGVADGDFVMLAGFPGGTDRYRTAAETKVFYDGIYPRQQRLLASYSDLIMAATAGDQDATIKYANALRGADNFKKKLAGQMEGATNIGLQAKKEAQERDFRSWAAEPARAARLAPVVAALDAAAAESAADHLRDLNYGVLNRAQLLAAARTLYRWSLERQKPDAERETGFQDRDERLVTERLQQIDRRFVAKVDRQIFAAAVKDMRTLPLADRNAAFDKTYDALRLDAIYADTTLTDAKARLAWMKRKPDEFKASRDPFIALAVQMYPEDQAHEDQDKARDGRMRLARSAYLTAYREYMATKGQALYPDANGSLRLTYGRVTGRKLAGRDQPAFTFAPEIAAKYTGKDPFDAPQKLRDLIAAKDFGAFKPASMPSLPVNYLSTLDITNGNSGSATLNARGEFVGLAFDGTIEGVIGDWWFDETINRTIHVDSRFMLFVMDKVDGAQNLLSEMGVQSQR